jgi:hypothetical protein
VLTLKIPKVVTLTQIEGNESDSHERSSSSAKQQAADRRIEIQAAEDEDGKIIVYYIYEGIKRH